MFATIARHKGGSPQLGATGPGTFGPYGRWPDDDDLGGGLDDEDDQNHDDT